MLRERSIEPGGDIWFVANICEEGLGDLRGMKAVVERFGANVQAYLVLEGLALGHVYHSARGSQALLVSPHAPREVTHGQTMASLPQSMSCRNWSCN